MAISRVVVVYTTAFLVGLVPDIPRLLGARIFERAAVQFPDGVVPYRSCGVAAAGSSSSMDDDSSSDDDALEVPLSKPTSAVVAAVPA